VQSGASRSEVPPGALERFARVDLEPDQSPDGVERVSEEEPRAIGRAEQVGEDRELACLDPRKQDGWSAGPVKTALDLRGFEVGVDLVVDSDQVSAPFEIVNAFAEVSVSHAGGAPSQILGTPEKVIGRRERGP